MKVLILLFVLLASPAFADVVTIDPTGWSQEEKNMITSMSSKILFDNGVTHSGIKVNNNYTSVEVFSPSGSILFLSTTTLHQQYGVWRAAMDISVAEAQAEELAKQTEYNSNPIKDFKISQIDAWVDSNVTNVAGARVVLKRIIRYLKARE